MKSRHEVANLANASGKAIEKTLGIDIRNGQGLTAVKAALSWVLEETKEEYYGRTKSEKQIKLSILGARTPISKRFWENVLIRRKENEKR